MAQYPEFVETYYSKGIFPIISKLLNTAFKWIPFSVGDLLYIALIVYVLRWVIKNVKRLRTHPKAWVLDVLSFVSLLYFMFHLFWGYNYYRVPLHTTLNLNPNYSTEQLKSVTHQLVLKTNKLHFAITHDSLLKTTLPYEFVELTDISQTGYSQLETLYPHFKHNGQNSKKSLFSIPLSYMGFSGYVNPITLEAQIKKRINAVIAIIKDIEKHHDKPTTAMLQSLFMEFEPKKKKLILEKEVKEKKVQFVEKKDSNNQL